MPSRESSLEEFMNGLLKLCNQTGIGIIFNVKNLGHIPEGKFISYFGRDDDDDVVPVIAGIDLDKLIQYPNESDEQ